MKDLEMKKQGLKRLEEARRLRQTLIFDESNIDMNISYRDAFTAIGDERTIEIMNSLLQDKEFGIDAARVLLGIWHRSSEKETDLQRIHSWPDFSVVLSAYERRQSGKIETTHKFAEEIMKIVGMIWESDLCEDSMIHAL